MKTAFVLLVVVVAVNCARDSLSIKSGSPKTDVYKDAIVCANGKVSFKPEVYTQHLNANCGTKNPKCVLYCHSENTTPYGYKVLDPAGTPTKEGYSEFIDSAVFAGARDKVTKHVHGCVDKHASKADINDSSCEGVHTFYSCVNEIWAWDC